MDEGHLPVERHCFSDSLWTYLDFYLIGTFLYSRINLQSLVMALKELYLQIETLAVTISPEYKSLFFS